MSASTYFTTALELYNLERDKCTDCGTKKHHNFLLFTDRDSDSFEPICIECM